MYRTDSSKTDSRVNHLAPARRSGRGNDLISQRLVRPLGCERGSNMIEMAFVVILMLSFIVGAVDLGSAYQQYGVVLNASREGARLYARLPCNSANRTALRTAIRNAAVNEPDGGVTITAQDVQITPDPASSCPAAGAPIAVRVTVLYRTQFGELLGLGDIPISARVEMVYFGSCNC